MLSNLKMWSYLSKDKCPTEDIDVNPNTTADENNPNVNASTNAVITDKASEWGSYLLEAGKAVTNIAAKQVTTTAKQLRQNVSEMNLIEHGNIISNFSSEQTKFKSEKRCLEKKKDEVCLPWIDALNCNESEEQNLKMKILSVSSDERNFTRNPPAGSDFEFNCLLYSPVALLLLKEDPKLAEMRFKLVPKKIKEEVFWRNYFYRISLIKQSLQSTANPIDHKEIGSTEKSDVVETGDKVKMMVHKETRADSPGSVGGGGSRVLRDADVEHEVHQLKSALIKSGSISSTSKDNPNENDDWEAELQKELSEFELINEDNGKDLTNDLEDKVDFDDLEKEIMNELGK